ncbi:hypothetical protein TB2_006521 [Malus domestica]
MFSRPEESCLIGSALLNLPRSSLESSSSSKTERLKSLIKYSPSCLKKDLKEKVLKILELDDLDDEEIRSEDVPSQHNMDEDYGNDKEDDCHGICPPIRPKK